VILFSGLLALVAFGLLLPTIAEGAALRRRFRGPGRPLAPVPAELPRLLFLVPAHDEALLISACVRSLRDLHYPRERVAVVVIADNCHDRTATLALEAGAACLVRTDPAQPGKPHAISWALDRLSWEAFDAVVIVDADSEVDPEFGLALARHAPLQGKAAQGYHMVLNPGESALTRLGALFGEATHRFAYPAKQRADLNTPLLGNGMVIGTDVLRAVGWPAFSICEDWEMYAVLTASGVRIDGVPEARVASQEARTLRQSASQRKRWTAGKWTVLARALFPLLRSRRIDPVQKLDAIGELSTPGPVVHLGIVLVGSALALAAPLPGGRWIAALLLGSLLRHAVYSFAALRADPDPVGTLRALAFLPWYTLWRAGIALGALTMLGDRPWVRTSRHTAAAPPHP
jgi:cellulose synthase/poly-beta-1,6-N-acetylglucosamine synthase-like glycosyltransferase